MQRHSLAKSVKLALTLGAASSALLGFQATAQEEGAVVEKISVTGSRIKRTDMETAQPVLLITAEDLSRTGLTSIGEIMKEIATNGASLGLQTNNGNTAGNMTVDLRDCGSNRTLVLVNGRRWVTELSGEVDLTTIPLAAIEQVEVLKDGASSIYGTDAICGVVNISTKKDFQGAELSAYVGEYDEGDGRKESYSFSVGTSNDKGSVLFAANYTKQEQVMGADREISSVPIFGLPANVSASGGRASPTTPYGQFRATVGDVTGSYTLTPGKAGCVPGQECSSERVADFHIYDPNTDGYNFAPVNYLLQPQESRSLYAQGHYELADNVRATAEAVYVNRTSEAQLAAQPLGGLAISADHVYNPFDQNIVGGSFRPIVAPRSFAADSTTWRFGAALEGEFELANREFNWDVGYGFAENKYVQLKNGFFNRTNFANALGASFIDVNGDAKCGTPDAVVAGCVPFNVFGGPDGVTADMLDYVTVAPRNLAQSKMHNYTANIGTELFELPAGPVAAVVGYEYRRESGFTNPDPLTVAGQVLGDNAATPTQGGFSLEEFYGEMVIPVLADQPFAESLELSLSTRYSDYSNFGDTTNSSYKLSYRPIEELLIRASYGEGFRAPSIQELYQGQNDSRPSATDPCSIASVPYTQNADVRSRCASAGVATDFQQKDPQFRAKVGGNPELQPEEATTTVFGFVYSPHFVENMGISVDWYNIEVENFIGTRTAQYIANACYVTGIQSYCDQIQRDFSGSLNGNPGEISELLSLTQNFVGGLEREGVDINVDYRFSTEVGDFRVNWDTAIMLYMGDVGQPNRGDVNTDGDISEGNLVGKLAPGQSGGGSRNKTKSNLSLSWKYDDWSASISAQYVSSLTENCANIVTASTRLGMPELADLCSDKDHKQDNFAFKPGTTEVVVTKDQLAPENKLGSVVYYDMQVGWTSPWDSQFTLGVRNLFDKEPPYAYSAFANTYDPSYRLPGRYAYISMTQRF
ncbi:TonB-dependent receptor [Bowmanella sp. Y26]|uniref:TonB-dependent receptor domain-containing protein n=1 Tax=Bowmanella yangjiangensis TaxID=2811230 RepID=UPI001BDCA7F9|nr:TonB-dependent receptor [Bowmanella yangjiangensis]MBT1064719.1 TonB-dependent receptor [Bowmanella yangjiangensis]